MEVSKVQYATKPLRQMMWISGLCNLCLSLLKIGFGLLASSYAVVADGLDSLTDVFTAFLSLTVIKYSAKEPDIDHPWGHGRSEAIMSKVMAIFMFIMASQLINNAVRSLFRPTEYEPNHLLLIAGILNLSIVVKALLCKFISKLAKKEDSLLLRSNARNMRNDVVLSLGTLCSLIIVHFFADFHWVDQTVCIILSLWIINEAYKLFRESNAELMDSVTDPQIYHDIIAIAKEVEGIDNPHHIRVRCVAAAYLIAIDIEIDGERNVYDAHSLCLELEAKIKAGLGVKVHDVMIHMEPTNNHESEESFGVSESMLKEIK